MKTFFQKNWQIITIVMLSIILTILVVKIFTPVNTRTELNQYKLEQLNQKIDQIKLMQKNLRDSITIYKNQVSLINKKIENIKLEKKEINNYYTTKQKEIDGYNSKQIDSVFKKRYGF